MSLVDTGGYNGIPLRPPGFYTTNAWEGVSLIPCPIWTGMLPAQGSVPAMEYHVAVQHWQAAVQENEQLRERIAVLEGQLAGRGM